jgi:hypothetical protein
MSSRDDEPVKQASIQPWSAVQNAPLGRVYRMAWWFRAFALFFLLFGGFFLIGVLRDILDGEKPHAIWEIAVSVVFPIIGAGMSAKAFTSRIIFSDGTIARTSFWDRRRVPLESIAGRREYVVESSGQGGSTRYLRLELNDGSSPLDCGKNLYRFDDAFWRWFNQLPDLDARDKQTHLGSNFGLV